MIPPIIPPSWIIPKRNPNNMYNQLFHTLRSKPFPILQAAIARNPKLRKSKKAVIMAKKSL